MMYVMLSGQLPFEGDTLHEIFESIAVGTYSLTGEVWRNISPHAIDLLSKLLVLDPEQRLTAEQALSHVWFTHSFANVTLTITREVMDSFKNYRVKSKFQSEAYQIMVKYLDVRQVKDLKAAFMSLDREKNGHLSVEEVQQGLISAGYAVAANEIREIMRNVDFRKDGRINYSEFLAATLESRALLDDDAIWNAFNTFDVDKSGLITEANVKEALRRAGRRMSHCEIREMMREVGAGPVGINYVQFKQLVRQDTTSVSTIM
jgi:calcium-dependent protein kinase